MSTKRLRSIEVKLCIVVANDGGKGN